MGYYCASIRQISFNITKLIQVIKPKHCLRFIKSHAKSGSLILHGRIGGKACDENQ